MQQLLSLQMFCKEQLVKIKDNATDNRLNTRPRWTRPKKGSEENAAYSKTHDQCEIDDFDLLICNTIQQEDQTLGIFNSLVDATVAYDREVVKVKGVWNIKCRTEKLPTSCVLCSSMFTAFSMQALKHTPPMALTTTWSTLVRAPTLLEAVNPFRTPFLCFSHVHRSTANPAT